MATTEHTINAAIAGLLRETRRVWRDSNTVTSENIGMLKESNARPDILVIEQNVSPVVIETEVLLAITVEAEALSRLGKQLRTAGSPGRTILSSIAVRLPRRLRDKQGDSLKDELATANDIEIALYTGSDPSTYSRWPYSGWILGSIADLSILVQSASIPPSVIDAAADQLITGVSEAAYALGEMVKAHPGLIHGISELLHQEDGPQTRRMAMTILANAFMFHENLAGGEGELADVRSLAQLKSANDGLRKMAVGDEWQKILKVNYWPIFDIARRILAMLPPANSQMIIEGLAATAERLIQNQLMRSHDLTGAVFQRLIADRKFLAAYYTTPASAALLIGLAITPDSLPAGRAWSNPEDMKALRIADFACGTGTLLSSAYQRISQLHELAGGDAEAIHPQMMATGLVGCDVLPAAAHLTASMLAGSHPTIKYEQSSVLTVAYGKQPDGDIALGSLNLLDAQGRLDIISNTATAKALEGTGTAEKNTWRSLPHASFDMVIMNPPFTRATNHEGQHANVPNPMFAAFSSSKEEQTLMGKAAERLTKGTSAHGNAGEASMFLALAESKLKPGGTLALVMPLTLLSGSSWEKSRALLYKEYSNLIVVTIASTGSKDMSFSADTGMGECLISGRRAKSDGKRAIFVILNKSPAYPIVGATAAEQVHKLIAGNNIRCLEDGPIGGNPLKFGNDIIAQVLDAPLPESGTWNLIRIADLSLAQTAYQLIGKNRVWLPTMQEQDAIALSLTKIGNIGKIGTLHRDVNGKNTNGSIRGPFELSRLQPNSVPTYPTLWAHDADRERTMTFEADHDGLPYRVTSPDEQANINRKVERVWGTASHCHVNLDFRFNSQSTAMQFTSRKTIGGRAWLSIQLPTSAHEKALVLWANTSFGLLVYWWHASKQQSGRGSITKQTLYTLPTLDVTALTPDQLAEAVKLFDEMSQKPLLTFHQLDKDPIRKELDERFGREVLGLPEHILAPSGSLDLLRMKLSREPSIRGGKKD